MCFVTKEYKKSEQTIPACRAGKFEFYGGTIVADKIQNAYHDSKNIYDGVLT